MEYQVSARKYRPGNLESVIGQPHVVQTLTNAIERGQVAHAYVFSGMRGVGKTTVARILAKALNCEQGPTGTPCETCASCEEITRGQSVDVIEIDGASNTGVDDVRELRENVKFSPFRGSYRIYIIDEVHMLSNSAFNALLKTLEEPPAHAIFIFATTEAHKIPATILSRCQHFTFRRISRLEIVGRLRHVIDQAGGTIEDRSLTAIARASDGSMRDALSLLDQAMAFGGTDIRHEDLEALLGAVPDELVRRAVEAVIQRDASAGVAAVGQAMDQGYDIRTYCREIVERLRNVMIAAVVPSQEQVQGLIELPVEEVEATLALAKIVDTTFLEHAFATISQAEDRLRLSSHARFLLEAAIIRATLGPGVSAASESPRSTTASASPPERASKTVATEKPAARPAAPRSANQSMPVRESAAPAKPAPRHPPPSQSASASPPSSVAQPVRASVSQSTSEAAGQRRQSTSAEASSRPAKPRAMAPAVSKDGKASGSTLDWGTVMDRLMHEHPNIGTFVEMGTLVQVDADEVVIGYPKNASVARWRTDKPENRALVARLCQQVAGRPVTVRVVELDRVANVKPTIGQQRAVTQQEADQSLIDEARANPIVKQTLEIFGGDVISARRVPPTEEKS